jgi:hypothetical protein
MGKHGAGGRDLGRARCLLVDVVVDDLKWDTQLYFAN